MAELLDVDLTNEQDAYALFVLRADEFTRAVREWYIAAHGHPPATWDLHHMFWRVISERLVWKTLRHAMQTTWPRGDQGASIAPSPVLPEEGEPPAQPPVPDPSAGVGAGGVHQHFGNGSLLQVTNASDGEFHPRFYSYWANAVVLERGIYVFAGHVDGQPRFFRIHSGGHVDRLGPLLGHNGTAEGWYWDAEGWVYLLDGPRLHRANPFTGADRIVFDISDAHPGCILWQAHSSDDGQTHSATVKRVVNDGAYPAIGTVVFRHGRQDFFPSQGSLDESQVSRDGGWLVIKEDDDNRVINLHTRETQILRDADGAVGHSDMGHGFMVGEDNIHGACVLWNLREPLTPERRRPLFNTWNMGYVSTRGGRCLHSGETHLGLVAFDGSGVTPLIAHGGGSSYDERVKANLSPCGRVACYMSHGLVYLLVMP
jgi:hypothetical protein